MAATTAPKARTGRSWRTKARPSQSDATSDTGVRRVAIYARRSTDEEHQPFSIDAQIAALRAYAASQPGWSVVCEFTDDASGATTDRPDLQRALTAARAGRYDVLLVYRVDRFSRRLSIMLDLMHDLDTHGVAFCSATESFDTSTAIGRMLVQLLGVFAEFERETIIDRVTKGMAAKATKGRWPGGRRPYGYRIDKDTQHLVPHDPEVATLKTIYRLYTTERLGTRAIATELNERGIRNATGNIWSGFTIARILDNPAYTGDLAYSDVYVTDAHPPIIDRDTFARARQIADARADSHTQRAASPSDYHLTGLITCPACGSKYIGTAAHNRTRVYRYYTCYSRNKYGVAGCKSARLNADATDNAVLTALTDFYANADTILARVITTAQEQFHDAHTDRRTELDTITTQIKQTAAAIDRYHAAFEAGTMDDTIAGPRIKDLRHKITQLKARHHDLTEALTAQPARPPPGTLDFVRAYLRDLITTGTPGERKRAIEALIHEIRITDDGNVIPVFKIPTSQTHLTPTKQHEPVTTVTGSRNGAVGGPGKTRTLPLTFGGAPRLADLVQRSVFEPMDQAKAMDLAAIGIARLAWRDSPVEDWHASPQSRISDAELMRANAAITRSVRDHLGGHGIDATSRIRGGTTADSGAVFSSIGELLTDRRRPLPDGSTLRDLAPDEAGLDALTRHVRSLIDHWIRLSGEIGADTTLALVGQLGGTFCRRWWLGPDWPFLVAEFVARVQDPTRWQDPTRASHVRKLERPPSAANPEFLRTILLAGPDLLDAVTAQYCLSAGLGSLLPQDYGSPPCLRHVLPPSSLALLTPPRHVSNNTLTL